MSSLASAYVRLSVYLDLAVHAGLIFILCPGILVTWSPRGIDVGVQASLIQFYPILLSTLLSINRKDLSLYDASYALLLSSSPLTIYLVVASICDLFGFETDFYKRIKFHRRTIRTLGVLVPLLWLWLSLTLRFSNRAFVNSELCRNSSFKDWLSDLFWSLMVYITFFGGQFLGLGFLPACGLAFGLCLFRRRSQMMEDFRAVREGGSKSWGELCMPWTLMKCAWCVSAVVVPNWPNLTPSRCTVDRHHKWCVYFLFAYLDYCWAYRVILSAIRAAQGGYVLSYGQV
jgi:hypothetical protein